MAQTEAFMVGAFTLAVLSDKSAVIANYKGSAIDVIGAAHYGYDTYIYINIHTYIYLYLYMLISYTRGCIRWI